MNGRILELAKNPELFQIKDLELLNGEIHKHPYIQSLRALYLLGTHRLNPENYAHELSITAAYTTDKKILYQLINSTEEAKSSPKVAEEQETALEIASTIMVENEVPSEEPKNKFTEIESKEIETPRPVFVNGELNRILFEGEEDFLERELETIDLESTIEAGQIVTQKVDNTIAANEQPRFTEVKDAENFSKQTIVKEKIIADQEDVIENPASLSSHETEALLPEVKLDHKDESSENAEAHKLTETDDADSFSKETIVKDETIFHEESVIEDSSTLSFHATADFLPEVKITSTSKKEEIKEVKKPALNKYEVEMQRLIAEVEAKMKATKTQKKPTEKEEIPASANVNFSETQSFDIVKTEGTKPSSHQTKEVAEKEFIAEKQLVVEEKSAPQAEETAQELFDKQAEPFQTGKPAWKPMSFSSNIPDALISENKEEVPAKNEVVTEDLSINKEDDKESAEAETQTAERPIFNMSFFTKKVSALEKENKTAEIQLVVEEKKTAEIVEDSNVPQFINTWQSWLKIDRTKEEAKEKIEISITEIKNKVIENFIEKEPRISKLKEESDFVIKERNDDISHLMTETLANLYTEQKLYAKAIKAFGTLSEKHPDKKDHFDTKIKQIKELRQNK